MQNYISFDKKTLLFFASRIPYPASRIPYPVSRMDCPFDKLYPSELNRDADYFMTHAYNEAIEAWKKDEVPIGAVIEHEGRIIASARLLASTSQRVRVSVIDQGRPFAIMRSGAQAAGALA